MEVHPRAYENFDKKCLKRVTIDIDHVRSLPIPLVKAVKLFGYDRVRLYRSASGTGFRIEILGDFTPAENILIRCSLDDDPFRIRFALHRYLLSGLPEVLDVAFAYKIHLKKHYQGKVLKIPVEEIVTEDILKKYDEGVLFKDIAEEIIQKLNPYIKKLYLYIIVIPAVKEYIEYVKDKLDCKILADPYYEDRVIVYCISGREDLVEELKKDIPVITYKRKEVTSKTVVE